MRMTFLARPKPDLGLSFVGLRGSWAIAFCAAWSWRTCARLRPKSPAPPTRRSSRREKPSQVLPGRPGMESIGHLLFAELVGKAHPTSSVVQERGTVHQRPGEILGVCYSGCAFT